MADLLNIDIKTAGNLAKQPLFTSLDRTGWEGTFEVRDRTHADVAPSGPFSHYGVIAGRAHTGAASDVQRIYGTDFIRVVAGNRLELTFLAGQAPAPAPACNLKPALFI